MQLRQVQESFEIEEKEKKISKLKITNRDLEILQFILEMKFVSLIDVKKKFFRFSKDGTDSISLWPVYERMHKLLKHGFIFDEAITTKEKLFLITEKGYYYLRNSYPREHFCKPVFDIDIRTLTHDRLVTQTRINLEISRSVSYWKSERALSEDSKFRSILGREFRPDGLYSEPCGQKVAFELEISQKSNVRYESKIQKFLSVIRESADQRLFEKVHFVCSNETVFKKLKDKTQLFKTLFKIEMESSLTDEVIP